MINNIAIANFQSHKETVLDLSPGVNVIVGPSDSGKTAIIRALRWLVWNRPTGDAFRSNWGGQTEVWVSDNNGYQITRSKNDKGLNVYRFQEEIFEGFGTDVPDQIQKVLNIDEVNLQSQLDAPFLLSLSPGEVARYFNDIAHLTQIDTGLKNINGWLRQLDSKRGFLVEQQTQFAEELEQYEYLDKVEIELEVLEDEEKRAQQLKNTKARLIDTYTAVTAIATEMERYSILTELEPAVDAILKQREEVELLRTEEIELRHAANDLARIHFQLTEHRALIELEPEVDVLSDMIHDMVGVEESYMQLKKLIERIELNGRHTKAGTDKIEILEQRFHDNIGEVCPLCGTKLSNK